MDWFYHQLIELSVNHGGHLLVAVALLLLLMSGMGLPLPEDIPLLFSGILCSEKVICPELMIPLAFVAVLGADSILYLLGRRYGHHVPRLPLLRKYLSEVRLERAQAALHEHAGKTLFVARFLPGIRAPVFFTAGIFKIPYWKFLAVDGTAALFSVPFLILIAYFGSENIDKIRHMAREAQIGIALVACLIVALFLMWKTRRRRANPTIPPLRPTRTPTPSGHSHS